MPSLALIPSLRHHFTTHLPHRRTEMTNSEHFWGQPPLCGSRNSKSPIPRSPSTATPLWVELGCTFRLLYSYKCSRPPTICLTKAPEQQQSWSHSVSCGQACRRIATPGHVFASPASAPKSHAIYYSVWRLNTAGSPFSARSYKPLRAPSDVSGLNILPDCS